MKSANQNPRVSVCIIIPVCNEEDTVPLLRRRLHALQRTLGSRYCMHYLFVDDGSTDDTAHLLPRAVPKGVTYEIRKHAINRGVGAALRTGFEHAAADIVCTIDADCSYGPENLLSMIQQVESSATDVIVASPYHPLGSVEGVNAWRRVLSSECSSLYRLVSPLKLHTYTSIFRVYRGDVVKEINFRSDGFVSVVEILLSAARLGYRISEKPLTLYPRVTGVSKMKIARTIRGHLGLMIGCMFTPSADSRRAVKASMSSRLEPEQLRFRAANKASENGEGMVEL